MLRVNRVCKVYKAFKASLVQQVLLVQREPQVLRVNRVFKVYKAFKASLVRQVQSVSKD